LERSYIRGATFLVRHNWIALASASLLVMAAVFALMHVPTGFIPLEDQGYLLIAAQTADAASLERTHASLRQIQQKIATIPGVDHVVSIGGVSALDNNAPASNAGILYVTLKDWSVRGKGEDLRSLYVRLNHELADLAGVRTLVLVPPPIQGLGSGGGFQSEVVLEDGSRDYARLQRATDSLIDAVSSRPEIQVLMSPLRADVPQVDIRVDRVRAEAMQVGVENVFEALEQFIGTSFVNQFTLFDHTFQVYVQADGNFRKSEDDLRSIFVRSNAGQMVPLADVVQISHGTGPAIASLYNLRPAAALTGTPSAAYSTGQAMHVIDEAAKRVLPPGVKL
jgi:HAE1 family hydrophobic/amphiphilic exporter-1